MKSHAARWLCLLAALLALVTVNAAAAITLDATSSSSVNGGASLAWSHTVGAGANRVLVVCVSTENSPEPTVSSVTFGGQALTQVTGARAVGSTYNATDLWYLLNPTTSTNTITVTLSGSAASTWGSAVSMFGANQAAPEAVNALGQAGGGSYSLALTVATAGAWVVDVVNNGTAGAAGFTPGHADMVERADSATTNHRSASSTRAVPAAGAVTNTWTTDGISRRAHSMAAFAPAAGSQPLAVAITSPADSATVGQSFTITASASVSPATITSVTFKDGAATLGVDTTSPYSWDVTGAALGSHTLTAVALGSTNATLTSAAVNVTVAGSPVTLLSQNFSTDPVNWETTGTWASTPFAFDTSIAGSRYWALSNTAGLTVNPAITGADGTYLATQNIDGGTVSFSSAAPAHLDFAVPAASYSGLKLSLALAGLPTAEDVNFIRAKTDNDGDGIYETLVFEFKGATNSAYTSSSPSGTLSAAFQTFSNIALPSPTGGNTVLHLRIESFNDTDSQNEATGIDSIVISGSPLGPQSPTVAITSPANAATVPTSFTINATAADSDGTVTSVSFYDGVTLLGTDTTSPYSYAWTGASVGSHALTAVALDNSSSSTTSSAVNVTVSSNNPPSITPTAPADEATGTGSSTTVSVSIADPEAAATTVTFYGRRTTPLAPGPDFTLMTLPDTQFYSQNTGGLRADTYYAQTQWITDNRDTLNVAFVSHMGDMVQNGDFSGNPREWLVADAAMRTIESHPATLRAHGIPWGGAPGNHDQSPIGNAAGTTVFFNEYFGSSRYAGRTYYGGHYGTNNNNNYQLFRASGLDFIILHLEFDTRSVASYQAVLDWADALLKAYPNRRAIVTTHWMVNAGDINVAPGIEATFSTQGQAIYDNLKDNPNLFLLLGGHIHGEGRRDDVFEERTVNSILQDYQGRANGGDGWLRYFLFSPANNTITAKTYKVANTITPGSGYEADADSEFTLTYNMQSAVTGWIPLGTVNVAAGGTAANLNWTGLEAGARYEWYATVSDGISTVTSATRRFSTTAPISPTVALTSPANGANYAPPGTVNFTATAGDADGSVARVEFYTGTTKLGEDASAPYEFTWTGAPSGAYALTAVAVDNSNRATLSSVVTVTVTGLAPTIALTSPADGATGSAPATISFAATAADSDGTVTKVEFYQGSYKVGEDTAAPYTYSWTNVAPGNYLLSAVAVDNAGNRTASTPVSNVISAVSSSGTLARGPYLQKAAPTQMTVRWRSSLGTVGRVRYGTSVMNLSQFADEPGAQTNHVGILTGLTAGTTYFYSVGSASDTLASGPTYTFTTPPTDGTAIETRVWVLGDAGTSGNLASADPNQVAVRDAFYTWTGARTPNLVLQLGDNAYNAGTDGEFQKGVFDIYPTMLRRTPFWSCLGNHETAQATDFVDTYPYFDIYTLPTAGESGGVPSGTEHYYSFDYGNIHFVCLDSMTASRTVDNPATTGTNEDGPMAAWLRTDLASTTATWIIGFFHHPPYTKGSHNSDTESELIQMRANFLPILEAGGVDLVLTGHSHAYERSYLLDGHYGLSGTLTAAMKKNAGDGLPAGNGAYLKPLTGPRDHFGAVYALTGSAGKISNWTGGSSAVNNPTPHPAMFVSLRRLGSLVLDVNGTRLDATFLREDGSTPDTFTIIKQGAADSDADGIPDEYEIAYGLNRFSAADAALDSDFDGISNLNEFIFSTASNVSDRYAFSTAYNSLAGTATVTFPTATGRTYRVLYSANLLSWQPASAVVTGTGATMLWTDDGTATVTPPSAAGKRFYRIEVMVVP